MCISPSVLEYIMKFSSNQQTSTTWTVISDFVNYFISKLLHPACGYACVAGKQVQEPLLLVEILGINLQIKELRYMRSTSFISGNFIWMTVGKR